MDNSEKLNTIEYELYIFNMCSGNTFLFWLAQATILNGTKKL